MRRQSRIVVRRRKRAVKITVFVRQVQPPEGHYCVLKRRYATRRVALQERLGHQALKDGSRRPARVVARPAPK